jgi:hypothetical protein
MIFRPRRRDRVSPDGCESLDRHFIRGPDDRRDRPRNTVKRKVASPNFRLKVPCPGARRCPDVEIVDYFTAGELREAFVE